MIYVSGLLVFVAILLTLAYSVGRPVPLWVPVLLVCLAMMLGAMR